MLSVFHFSCGLVLSELLLLLVRSVGVAVFVGLWCRGWSRNRLRGVWLPLVMPVVATSFVLCFPTGFLRWDLRLN